MDDDPSAAGSKQPEDRVDQADHDHLVDATIMNPTIKLEEKPKSQAQDATQEDIGIQQEHQAHLPVTMKHGPQATAQPSAPPAAPANVTASTATALPIPPVVPSNMTPKGRLMSSACRKSNTTNPHHTFILQTPAHKRTAARNRSCIVCGVWFSREASAKSHFEGFCFDYYGNPNAHYWDDHESFPVKR